MENRETEAAPTAAACQLLNGMMVVGQSRRKGIAGQEEVLLGRLYLTVPNDEHLPVACISTT